jgi:hypothetical protein
MIHRKRNIGCLESLWNDSTENRLNVIPVLDLISKQWSTKFSHLSCNTVAELRYNLDLLRKRNYGVLYLAFHGSPGKIRPHGHIISLSDLAGMMGKRFRNWIIHFGSCSTLRYASTAEHFVEATGVSIVTGYRRDVDWVESTALEMLLFQNYQRFSSPRVAVRNLIDKHASLVEITGFRAFPDRS